MATKTKKPRSGLAWLNQMFSAQAVSRRIVIRRKKSSVEKFASFALLEAHCKKHGFHVLETGDQYLVICNDGFFKLHF